MGQAVSTVGAITRRAPRPASTAAALVQTRGAAFLTRRRALDFGLVCTCACRP